MAEFYPSAGLKVFSKIVYIKLLSALGANKKHFPSGFMLYKIDIRFYNRLQF